MNKKDLLLEIGLEEMPARFVTNSMNQLSEKIKSWLESKQIGYGEVQAFSTPRRLAVFVKDVDVSQQDIHEEAKGPAKKIAQDANGEWTKAAIGFANGQGATVEDIYFKEIKGVEYVHVNKFVKGLETKELLGELKQIITGLSFPKNMRWASNDLKYIRPIKWLIALFGDEVVPFDIVGVNTSNWSLGHRFLGEKIEIASPAEYETALLGQHVIVDGEKRKEAIVSQIQKLEEENNWVIPIDETLLEEVNNLVEYPTALFGKFEGEFLQLPEEVLITSMKEHQRYFPVKSKDGELQPFFVTIRNGDHLHLDKVAKGNEKVLRARLSDAAFFYKEDHKLSINDALSKLGNIVYHEEIGTLSEKVGRVRKLTNELTNMLSFDQTEKESSDRAAEICKFDLVTNMVYEFPELQGFMGEKYALQKGETEQVAKAVNEHYMPRNAEDATPSSNEGAVLSIADKLDTIVSFFSIGVIPSGSQDPYALRRQASGIVQILIQKDWHVELEDLIKKAVTPLVEAGIAKQNQAELENNILSFFKLRIKYILQELGSRYDLIDSVLANKVGVISSLVKKVNILNAKKEEESFKESMEALSRVINISSKAESVVNVKEELFENEHESKLYQHFTEISGQLNSTTSEEEYYQLLVSLKDDIANYFEHTMVMADDQAVRQNRLSLMVKIAEKITQFANVNEINVK